MALRLHHCLVLLFFFVVLAGCEDRRADKAYLRGDYESAARELKFLANKGEARAQYDLAVMYDKGQGVPQNNEEAAKWYERAAEQGEPRAQYNLGLMYMNGQGLPRSLPRAYYWVSLSARHGDEHAVDAKDYLTQRMTREEMSHARALLLEHDKNSNDVSVDQLHLTH